MQYNMLEGGGLEPLPAPSIDTGAGVERVSRPVAGRAQRLRDRRLRRRDLRDRALVGRALRRRRAADQGAAGAGRPRPRRCASWPATAIEPGQRGPRLRAAADRPPGDLARPARSGWSATSRRACTRGSSSCGATCIPSCASSAAHVRRVLTAEEERFSRTLEVGGGAARRRARPQRRRRLRRRRVPAARHLRLPVRADGRDRRRARQGGGRGRASRG